MRQCAAAPPLPPSLAGSIPHLHLMQMQRLAARTRATAAAESSNLVVLWHVFKTNQDVGYTNVYVCRQFGSALLCLMSVSVHRLRLHTLSPSLFLFLSLSFFGCVFLERSHKSRFGAFLLCCCLCCCCCYSKIYRMLQHKYFHCKI